MKVTQLTCLLFIVISLPFHIQALPVQVPYSGQLADSGELVNGNRTLRFEILDAASAIRYDTGPLTVAITNGGFRVLLGGTNQPVLDSAVFAEPGRRLRITVANTVLTPDQDIHYTAYAAHAVGATTAVNALEAGNANQLGGVPAQNYARLNVTSAQNFAGPVTAGTVTATTFVGSGSGLFDLNASQLVSGTVPESRLPGNLARLNRPNNWSTMQTFSAGAVFDGNLTVSTGTVLRVSGAVELPITGISGGGTGSGLNADLLDGMSSEQFARLSSSGGTQIMNVFSSAVTFQNSVRLTQPIEGPVDGPLVVNGALAANSFSGNGAALTGLNAGQLTTGTVDDARLSANVARLSAPNVFSSAVTFNGSVRLTQPVDGPADGPLVVNGSLAAGSLSGNGAGLTSLNAAALTSGAVSSARGGLGLDTSAALAGSLLRTVSPGVWQTLPPGAEGQVLKVSGGLPVWGTDNAGTSGGGSVTAINPGVGISLSPSPITTSGTVSIDSTVVPLKNAANTFCTVQTFEGPSPMVFEGATVDGNKTTLTIAEPTAPRTVILPDASGTLGVVGAYMETASTTPSVKGRTAVVLGGATLATITDLVDGIDGQIVVLIGGDGTNAPRIESGGNFRLRQNAAWLAQLNSTLMLVRANGVWFEVSRSQN